MNISGLKLVGNDGVIPKGLTTATHWIHFHSLFFSTKHMEAQTAPHLKHVLIAVGCVFVAFLCYGIVHFKIRHVISSQFRSVHGVIMSLCVSPGGKH